MIKATIDLNVLLDFLNQRKDHVQAAKIIDLCVKKIVKGFLCAHEVTTLAYFLLKSHNDREKIKKILTELFDIFDVIPVTGDILRDALYSKIKDYEDAVIEESSFKYGVNYIVTRNLDDFKQSKVKSLSPTDFLKIVLPPWPESEL